MITAKPREWWLAIGITSVGDDICYTNEPNLKSGSVHVIEKSAYDELKEELEINKAIAVALMKGESKLQAQADKLAEDLESCFKCQSSDALKEYRGEK